ncbi:PTS sugar transporter subunit IIA [Mesorhizobium sp. ISC11]|uniref:PTS sugar transporter subunit IIA n=1 Tax=Mesorhizobium sp. ISC11 TaxID=3076428 RepID=UPI003FA5B038
MPVPPTLIDPARNAATSAERGTWALGEVARTSSSIHPATKREALWPLGSARRKGRASREAVLAALLRRERRGPTYIGGGIAMPHGRNDESLLPAAAVLRLRHLCTTLGCVRHAGHRRQSVHTNDRAAAPPGFRIPAHVTLTRAMWLDQG